MESNFLNLEPGQILIGIGSNEGPSQQGEPIDSLRKALQFIKGSPFWDFHKVSPIYESEALLPDGAPAGWNRPFLNAVCSIKWNHLNKDFDPQLLLSELQKIEEQMGRSQLKQRPKWAPRPIDLDVLFWSYPSCKNEHLTVPHPHAYHRPFVLLPLLDIMGSCLNFSEFRNEWWYWLYASSKDIPQQTKKSGQYFWPKIVGILNCTPDSFSDGNAHYLNEKFIDEKIARLITEGAEVIDIGAESTRPNAIAITPEEEIRRLNTALPRLHTVLDSNRRIEVSLDTRHFETMKWALAKFPWIRYMNDVEGFNSKDKIVLLKDSDTQMIFMHSLTAPVDPLVTLATDQDAVNTIIKWAHEKIRLCENFGISRNRMILDPGIGFGKTPRQNWDIINRVESLFKPKLPVFIGHSRKGFLGLPSEAQTRDFETAISVAQLKSVDFIRVHQPLDTKRALACASFFTPSMRGCND